MASWNPILRVLDWALLSNNGQGQSYSELTEPVLSHAVIGAAAGVDTGTAGTVYWDGFEARRGSHIGPLGFGPASKALAAPLRVSLAASFVYDGDGRRVAQTINGTTTYFVGSYYEKTGGTVTKYYYAGSQRVAMKVGSTVYYLLSDHLGSTSLTTDAGGNVLSEMRYSAWGSVRYSSGDNPTDYTFTGQYSDDELDLLDYVARRYDPQVGRFLSPDTVIPIASQGMQAWDRYAYVNNSPINYDDPSGHCLVVCTAIIGGAVGGILGAVGYTAYVVAKGREFNTTHMLLAAGGGAAAGALIGTGVGIVAGMSTAAATTAAVTGGGAAVLEATGGDPSDEMRVVEQTVQGTGQVVKDLIARSELIEKASNELVYQSPGGLNGAQKVFNSLAGNVNEIVAKGGTILNKTLDSGGQVLFRTWSSVTRNSPSTPVLQFKDIPGFETLLKFHFPE